MGKTYWMLVTTGENFETTRERGFDVQGIESSQRRKAQRISPDDRIVFYLSDRRQFAATVTVTSSHFEDDTRIWKHYRESEVFPHRVKIRADAVPPADRYLDAYQIGPRLEYVKKWPPEEWELAFIGGLHIIPQKDFSFLEDEMRRVLSILGGGRGPRRRNRRGRRRSQDGGRQGGYAGRGDRNGGAGRDSRRDSAERGGEGDRDAARDEGSADHEIDDERQGSRDTGGDSVTAVAEGDSARSAAVEAAPGARTEPEAITPTEEPSAG